jgi:hypothetical protein
VELGVKVGRGVLVVESVTEEVGVCVVVGVGLTVLVGLRDIVLV